MSNCREVARTIGNCIVYLATTGVPPVFLARIGRFPDVALGRTITSGGCLPPISKQKRNAATN